MREMEGALGIIGFEVFISQVRNLKLKEAVLLARDWLGQNQI